MLFIISPAKKLDLSEETRFTHNYSQPRMLEEAEKLAASLVKMKPKDLGVLMHISDQLAGLNYERYQTFAPPFSPENAKQAILCFNGDVYQSIEVEAYTDQEFDYAQHHLRILSGLYGLLKPLDLIQPYRLEMGTKLETRRGKDLYEFWGDRITKALNDDLAAVGSGVLINLASNEYFKSVRPAKLKAEVITPIFKDNKNGTLKVLSLFAKQARGAMVDYAIKEKVSHPDQLKDFRGMNYAFREDLSSAQEWVFVR